MPKVVDRYMAGKIQIDPMSLHMLSLEDMNKGFDLMQAGESIRAMRPGPRLLRGLCLAFLLVVPALAQTVPTLQITAGADHLDITADQIKSVQIVGPLLLPTISVVLVPDLDAAVVQLTARHVGEMLVIRACGEEIMRPVLQEPLSKAAFMLAVKDGDEAHRVARRLMAKDCAG